LLVGSRPRRPPWESQAASWKAQLISEPKERDRRWSGGKSPAQRPILRARKGAPSELRYGPDRSPGRADHRPRQVRGRLLWLVDRDPAGHPTPVRPQCCPGTSGRVRNSAVRWRVSLRRRGALILLLRWLVRVAGRRGRPLERSEGSAIDVQAEGFESSASASASPARVQLPLVRVRHRRRASTSAVPDVSPLELASDRRSAGGRGLRG
jgi:hypothetical protein